MKEDVPKNIDVISFFLSVIAGYADTTTFICANRLFSAHITGNFVVFVYNIVTKADPSLWLNLLSFPFFIAGVVFSSSIVYHPKYPGRIIKMEAILFLITGVTAAVLKLEAMESSLSNFLLSMLVVVAMGLHNSFSKFYTKATYSSTTVMTGNVTQITLDFLRYVRTGTATAGLAQNLRQHGLIIGGFFTGCLLGGWVSFFIGLPSIILPAIIIRFYFWKLTKNQS